MTNHAEVDQLELNIMDEVVAWRVPNWRKDGNPYDFTTDPEIARVVKANGYDVQPLFAHPPRPNEGETTWRDISTAPKDRFVLLYTPADGEMDGFIACAKWQRGSWFGIDDEGLTFNPLQAWDRVTHWQQLPTPPGSSKEPVTAAPVSELVEKPTPRIVDVLAHQDEIDRAAIAWCGLKDRETGLDDIRYFRANWRSLPGLEAHVLAEIEKRPEFARPNEVGFVATHRHVKRGSDYQVLGTASLQAGYPVGEAASLVVYRDAKGRLWARPEVEFDDGRFEALSAAPAVPPKS